jgi:hypothetical protein
LAFGRSQQKKSKSCVVQLAAARMNIRTHPHAGHASLRSLQLLGARHFSHLKCVGECMCVVRNCLLTRVRARALSQRSGRPTSERLERLFSYTVHRRSALGMNRRCICRCMSGCYTERRGTRLRDGIIIQVIIMHEAPSSMHAALPHCALCATVLTGAHVKWTVSQPAWINTVR